MALAGIHRSKFKGGYGKVTPFVGKSVGKDLCFKEFERHCRKKCAILANCSNFRNGTAILSEKLKIRYRAAE